MRLVSFLLVPMLLSGCTAGLKGDFTCDKIGGLEGCHTMGEIRQGMMNGQFSDTGQTMVKAESVSAPDSDFIPLPRRDRYGSPQRTSERLQKVTIFPYVTPENFYVDTTDVYIVLYDSSWTGRPVQSIRQD
ncbi:type IV conjugative transfer system lipoprotein TraV [Photobacterium sp. R1]